MIVVMKKLGLKAYLSDSWNLADIFTLILSFLAFALYIILKLSIIALQAEVSAAFFSHYGWIILIGLLFLNVDQGNSWQFIHSAGLDCVAVRLLRLRDERHGVHVDPEDLPDPVVPEGVHADRSHDQAVFRRTFHLCSRVPHRLCRLFGIFFLRPAKLSGKFSRLSQHVREHAGHVHREIQLWSPQSSQPARRMDLFRILT